MSAACQPCEENPRYLREQLLTYLGNKRALLGSIGEAVAAVRARLGGRRLAAADLFAGSGVVTRFLKQHSARLCTNDTEDYVRVLNTCYTANMNAALYAEIIGLYHELTDRLAHECRPGFITELYAPQNDAAITCEDRAFYTHRNALYLDTARSLIAELPGEMQAFFLAPLLTEASVHTNTGGVFKGFYKDAAGIGCFGGQGKHALERICGEIHLCLPVFSRFESEVRILQADAKEAARQLNAAGETLDLVYLDPPYNQHPYGSNYFMLNLLARAERPCDISRVSGIPSDWNRSPYNSRRSALPALLELLEACPASHILLSYNSEGFIARKELETHLRGMGTLTVTEVSYNTYRASRNLAARAPKVTEYLFLLERA